MVLPREKRVARPEAIRILITAMTNHPELIRSINDAAHRPVGADSVRHRHRQGTDGARRALFQQCKESLFQAQNGGALSHDLLNSELFGHKRGAFTGAISDHLGPFLAVDGGTAFLDEISEVSPSFQVSLLRFLQVGEVKRVATHPTRHCNVRIIAARNQTLLILVEQGRVRRNVYFRPRGFELTIPPLRDRVEDIVVLTEHPAKKYADTVRRRVAGISADVMQRLKALPFTVNVRELENEIRRIVALAADGEYLSMKAMSPEFARLNPREADKGHAALLRQQGSLKDRVEAQETLLVTQSLLRHT